MGNLSENVGANVKDAPCAGSSAQSCLSTTARGNLLEPLKVRRAKREKCKKFVIFLLLRTGRGVPTISKTPTRIWRQGVDDVAGVLM